MTLLSGFGSFGWPSRMLMINQFGINLGFYMLMPYLAGYLAGPWVWRHGPSGSFSGCAISPSRACSSLAARWPIAWASSPSS